LRTLIDLIFLLELKRKKQELEHAIAALQQKQPSPKTKAKAKAKPKAKPKAKTPQKKKQPLPKSKERKKVQQDLDEMDLDSDDEVEEQQKKQKAEVFDDLSQRTKKAARQAGELTSIQARMQDSLQDILDLVVGRIHLDPAKLRAPPEEFAARVLYQDHLHKLQRHFLTGGMFVAQKDFILFMEEVMNLNLNSSSCVL